MSRFDRFRRRLHLVTLTVLVLAGVTACATACAPSFTLRPPPVTPPAATTVIYPYVASGGIECTLDHRHAWLRSETKGEESYRLKIRADACDRAKANLSGELREWQRRQAVPAPVPAPAEPPK